MHFEYVTGKRSKRANSLLLAATALAASAASARGQALSLPSFGSTVYNITVPNSAINGGAPASAGATDNSIAINAYITYCSTHGGGTVEVPADTFDSNTITIKSNVNLEIDSGAVLFNNNVANTFIQTTGSSNSNIEISGGGIINGGTITTTGSNKCVDITNTSTLAITGVSIENTAQEHLAIENDSNVTVNNITIADPATLAANNNNYLANTDGIDFSGNHITIENSNINDGDDDIVAKSGSGNVSNVLITNDTIGAGHGISVGGGSADGLKNMTVSNITFNGTQNGLRLKAVDATGENAGGGTTNPVENVLFSNIVMNNVGNPILIDSFYNNGDNNFPTSATQTNHAVDTTTPMWENIGFNNITINAASNDGLFYDLNTTPSNLVGLSFNNVNINGSAGMTLWWGSNINLSGLTTNHTINALDLTNLTPAGTANITWNNANATVATTSLGDGATWDVTANENWNTGSSFTTYTNSSNVTFNDNNNGNYAVTLNTAVAPLSMTVNNSLSSYTISGTGMIAGAGSLTKNGSANLVLSTANAYTGGTIINAGTLSTASPSALGAGETLGTGTGARPGTTTVNANGTLDLDGQSLVEPITLNGGTLTNNNAATASVIGGVKGVGYTTTTAGIAAGSTITFSSGSAAATPVFGITAASFTGFTGTYAKVTTGSDPAPQAPNVIITPSDGKGSGAMGYAVLNNNTLAGVVIVFPGSGYDAAPIITFTGGTPTVAGSATGNANNFALVGIQTSSSGSGYNSPPIATLQNNGGAGTVNLTPVVGSVTLASTSSIGGNAGDINLSLPITGPGGLIKTGSDTLSLGAANTYAGGTTVNAGTLLVAANGALPAAPVSVTGGTLQLAASTGQATITSLSISGSGTFDLNNNHIIINYGSGADPISSIAALLAAGYDNGNWDGAGGIVTSAPLVVGGLSYGIGYADAADPQDTATGLASGTIEIAYTLLGDADLNGIVNGIDFGILAANFNKGVTGWDEGDFDYNNIVNGLDFGDLAANFNKGAAGADAVAALDAFAAANGLLADVPEPASAGLALMGTLGILAKRRRQKAQTVFAA